MWNVFSVLTSKVGLYFGQLRNIQIEMLSILTGRDLSLGVFPKQLALSLFCGANYLYLTTCMLAHTDKIFSLLTDEMYIHLFPDWPMSRCFG